MTDPTKALTRREHTVLRLAGQGHSPRAIGEALQVSPATVRAHRRRALRKLGALTDAQAAQQATP